MNYINLKFGGKFLINLKQNELVILSIFDYENNPIGKTELIKLNPGKVQIIRGATLSRTPNKGSLNFNNFRISKIIATFAW